jgi:hypothetical protein
MPSQDQQSGLSPDTIKSFIELPEESQRKALGSMSPAAKQALLDGLKQPTGGASYDDIEPATTAPSQPNSVIGGAVRRMVGASRGIMETIGKPLTPEEVPNPRARNIIQGTGIGPGLLRAGRGLLNTEKEAAGQARKYESTGQRGRAAITAMSMANPLATGSVVDINKMEDEGRQREALGAGAFDVLSLWLGKKIGEEGITGKVGKAKQTNKLAFATGGGAQEYPKVLNDLEQAAKRLGPPKTVGDLHKLVKDTLQHTETEFNLALQPMAGRQLVPLDVVNRIKANINSAMMQTADGQRMARLLNNIAVDYQKPWTLGDLNQERMNATARLRAFHAAGPNAQTANLHTNARVMADKAIEESTKDIVYGALGPRYRALKLRQSALKTINDQLNTQVDKLANAQAAAKGKPMFGSESVQGYAYPTKGVGIRAHIHLPRTGPQTTANRAVRQALPSRTRVAGRVASRAAVLSLPVQHLKEPARSTLPPPPSLSDDDY